MHRSTTLMSALRSYVSGGARSVVSKVDDGQFMQEMAGGFMSGESRGKIEAPQNYGFTSHAMEALQGLMSSGGQAASAGGFAGAVSKIAGMGPETFISFMGGARGFPVAGNMDDRRHRLSGLDQGDSGMFSTQGRKQQFHMSSDGMFGSAPNDKTMRMALLDEKSEQDTTSQSVQGQQTAQQAGGPAHAAALAAVRAGKIRDILEPLTEPIPGVPTLYDSGGTGSATSGTNSFGSNADGMKMGQKSLKDKNQQAKIFMDMTKDASRMAGKIVQLITSGSGSGGGGGSGGSSRAGSSGGSGGSSSQQQGTPLAEASSDSKFYCGGSPKKGKYALIVTVKGPTINVPGRIG
jgi:phage gp45-like